MAKKKQAVLIPEEPDKYDFYSDDYLIREGQKHPDIFLMPTTRRQVLLILGNMNMLRGKALEEYQKIIEGGSDED